ncbi:tetratricopeptide repeat-containing sensor histidine kinase [Hymenobacter segetis]
MLNIGFIHIYQGKRAEAEQDLLAVVAIKKAAGQKDAYFALEALHEIEYNKGNNAKSLAYLLQTLRSVQESGHEELLDYVYGMLGSLYLELDEVNTGVAYLKKSLALSQRNGQLTPDVRIISRLVSGLVKQGKAQEGLRFLQNVSRKNVPFSPRNKKTLAEAMAHCFIALKQYPQAEKYLLQSTALDSQVDAYGAESTWLMLSQLYIKTKQYAKARPYLKKLLAVHDGMIIPADIIATVHLASFQVDSAAGDYLSAIAHYTRYKALTDSIFSASKTRQVEELKMQYATTQKEQRIQLLTAKEQRQQSQLDRERIIRNGIIAGAGLLVLLLGVSYNRYRLKQRSNQLLEKKQFEINQKNHALEQVVSEKELLLVDKDQLLEDKEWMLKEIHHRVKNNLQIITSLLHSQTIYLTDKAALSAIRESQNRVQSMALIHQKLYQGTQLASVPMQAYVLEIANYLIASFDSQHFVRTELAVADVELDVSLAVPVGLILNEAITNSLKYAFPTRQAGIIRIELTRSVKTYVLSIRDNGVGLPADFNPQRSRTLGLSLIRGLSKQIDGRLQIDGQQGVCITLAFDDVEAVTRASRQDARVLAQD